MVEKNEANKSNQYTYLVRGENDGLNERTQVMTGKYSDNPGLAQEILDA